MSQLVDVVFDGPPAAVPGRFIEVENQSGASVKVGEWIDRGDGKWGLRIEVVDKTDDLPRYRAALEALAAEGPCSPGPGCPGSSHSFGYHGTPGHLDGCEYTCVAYAALHPEVLEDES